MVAEGSYPAAAHAPSTPAWGRSLLRPRQSGGATRAHLAVAAAVSKMQAAEVPPSTQIPHPALQTGC